MSTIGKAHSVLITVLKAKWKELTIPTITEFIFANIADFLEPKFRCVSVLWCIFLVITVICIYRIISWIKTNNITVPITKEKVFASGSALSDSLAKGISVASIGLIISTFFLVLQLTFSKNNSGAIASVVPELQPIQETLFGIDAKLDKIDKKLDNVKKETSDDARKELQNKGVAWNGKNFLEAVKSGDEVSVRLFLQGGMRPETAEADGRSLAVMLSLNEYNPEKMLSLLLEHGLEIDYPFEQFASSGDMKTTLLGRAIEKGNVRLAAALLKNNASTDKPLQTYGTMGIAVEKYPLQSAIYWKRKEIVYLILDADPDVSVGDYAAYRQVSAMKDDYYWRQNGSDLKIVMEKTRPTGSAGKRIDTELRIQEIDRKLTEVAKKSLQSFSNPAAKEEYDKRYDELQGEKSKLIEMLKAVQ